MTKAPSYSILAPLRLLLGDFVAFAGMKGVKAFLFVFLGTVLEGVGLVLLIPFFSVVIDSQTNDNWAQRAAALLFALFSAESRLAKLSLLVAFFSVLMIARAFIITVREVMLTELEIGFICQIRSRLTRRLAAAGWDAVSRLRHSSITYLLGAGIQQLGGATSILLHSAAGALILASQIVLAFLLAPRLTALVLCVVLLGAATLLPMLTRARAIGSVVSSANLSLIDDVTQFLGALKLAISQNLQKSFTRQFDATLDELKAEQVGYVRQQTITRLAVTTVAGLLGAFAMVVGVVVFDVSTSVLIALLVIFARMSGPAAQLQLNAQEIAYALPAYERILELQSDVSIAGLMAPADPAAAIVLPNGPIVFDKVSFLHNTANALGSAGGVRDIDLIIEPGSIVGVTGPSGAGKTTFADLLVGLYAPQSGAILVGAVALRGVAVTAWQNSVSYVAQDPFLFHDTIRRNLLWAKPDASEAALWDMLRLAGAEDIVRHAPFGIETVVGERGILLSGGERQRLCLARAMLRSPHLLVLDEATNAIDVEGEQAILKQLLRATSRPTIIMIAHRPQSLHLCQRVLYFERGRLVSDTSSSAHPLLSRTALV